MSEANSRPATRLLEPFVLERSQSGQRGQVAELPVAMPFISGICIRHP
jgi:hypothetical protein